jgi:hypothetical protein
VDVNKLGLNRISRLFAAPLVAASLLVTSLVAGAVAPQAAAAAVTPDLATINITLADADPAHNTFTYLNASKDNTVAAKISVDDPSGAMSIPESLGEIKGRGKLHMDPSQEAVSDQIPHGPGASRYAGSEDLGAPCECCRWVPYAQQGRL